MIDPTCSFCEAGYESICHVLFTCAKAKETWELSQIPLPPNGFSQTSVFLNLHHLIACSKKESIAVKVRQSFPWILWHLWKARNALTFESVHFDPTTIHSKAKEDAEIWLKLDDIEEYPMNGPLPAPINAIGWKKPDQSSLKCNIGCSWVSEDQNCGSAWLVRDHTGLVLFHSRRSFSRVSSPLEAELLSFRWAIESLKNLRLRRIIFESPLLQARESLLSPHLFPHLQALTAEIFNLLQSFDSWSLEHISASGNHIADAIATSVTQGHRYQSYLAKGGPHWLRHEIAAEAIAT